VTGLGFSQFHMLAAWLSTGADQRAERNGGDGRSRRLPVFSAALVAIVVVATATACGGAGPAGERPSGGFGRGGKVLTAVGSESALADIAIQDDGKIVAAGYNDVFSFALARFNGDGGLDQSFGRRGKLVNGFGSMSVALDPAASAVAVQRDGRIVAAGETGESPHNRFALARYTPDGNLDPTFGRGGKVQTAVGSESQASDVAIQDDGKIVAAGSNGLDDAGEFALARYTPDGNLDPTFGTSSKVLTGFGPKRRASASAVAIQRDGKIIAVGSSSRDQSDFALARYLSGGGLDPSFGKGGKVLTAFGSQRSDFARDVAPQADGKIVAAGSSCTWPSGQDYDCDFALARYLSDGRLDKSFGKGGKLLTAFGSQTPDYLAGIDIQADGKIVAAGESRGKFALAHYTADGRLDPSFGDGGKVLTGGGFGSISAIAFQRDGKIIAAGGPGFALARYNADGSLDS
jgi:uncharacterized delta-60 repeat protein